MEASEALMEAVKVNGFSAVARLVAGGQIYWRFDGIGGTERSLSVESDVLGFVSKGREIWIRAFVGGKLEKRMKKDFMIQMPTEEAAERWSDWLRVCLDSLGRPKRLFIIVNPFGGKKCAMKLFNTKIKPLLVAANILYTLQETKYRLHAREIAYNLDLLKYDGIICVSGDGVLVEVVNGLLQREDWDIAIRVPIGIIPAGTGNGLAKSLSDAVGEMCSIQNATFAIIRGHKRSLDVITIIQGEKKFFSILMLTWGFLADVDIESEKYRWMGSTRIDFYCLLRTMNLRKYSGLVEFVPAPGYEFFGERIMDSGNSVDGANICKREAPPNRFEAGQGCYQGPNACFEDSDWRFIEGPFISVSVINVPWIGETSKPAPEAKFSDGFLDLLIVKECPKFGILSIVRKTGDGSHMNSPYVTYLKVKAFRLSPGNCVDNPIRGGIIDVDGESIARGEGILRVDPKEDLMAYGPPIELTVDKGLATFFTPV